MKAIDLNTYGKTPACIYLAFQLTQVGNPRLANRVGQSLTAFREQVRGLEKANDAKLMSGHNVAQLANLLYVVADEQHEKFSNAPWSQPLVANLVRNIMVGELKSLLRRCGQAKQAQKDLQRRTSHLPRGAMGDLMVTLRPTVTDFEDSINADTLAEKSARKLERKGKISTLY
jgi:hypothetical protein